MVKQKRIIKKEGKDRKKEKEKDTIRYKIQTIK